MLGRVITNTSHQKPSFRAEYHTSRDSRLPPDHVLFSRKHAPERFAEKDLYYANDDLPEDTTLPQTGMLTAVHCYASNFYEALARQQAPSSTRKARPIDEKSMDETALLAFGIILEEASRHALGKRGHLVFTEEGDDDDNASAEGGVAEETLARYSLVDSSHGMPDIPRKVLKRRRLR